jgi:hypothetical protein
MARPFRNGKLGQAWLRCNRCDHQFRGSTWYAPIPQGKNRVGEPPRWVADCPNDDTKCARCASGRIRIDQAGSLAEPPLD